MFIDRTEWLNNNQISERWISHTKEFQIIHFNQPGFQGHHQQWYVILRACTLDMFVDNALWSLWSSSQNTDYILLFFGGGAWACNILVPQPGIEAVPPAVEAGNLNYWVDREVMRQSDKPQLRDLTIVSGKNQGDQNLRKVWRIVIAQSNLHVMWYPRWASGTEKDFKEIRIKHRI